MLLFGNTKIALSLLSFAVIGSSITACEPVELGTSTGGSDGRLIGTWRSDCVKLGSLYFYIGYTFKYLQDEFDNASCSGTPKSITVDYSYTVGSELTTDSGQTARELDYTIQNTTYFDIYSISNNSLYFGITYSSTSESRTTALDLGYPYRKQ